LDADLSLDISVNWTWTVRQKERPVKSPENARSPLFFIALPMALIFHQRRRSFSYRLEKKLLHHLYFTFNSFKHKAYISLLDFQTELVTRKSN
jgi:c-di-GMP-binding flagellar brake protein YcgR